MKQISSHKGTNEATCPRDPCSSGCYQTNKKTGGGGGTTKFSKKNHNGDIKVRACVDSTNQQEMIYKEGTASPPVATESVFITMAADAHEVHYVTTFDIPRAY